MKYLNIIFLSALAFFSQNARTQNVEPQAFFDGQVLMYESLSLQQRDSLSFFNPNNEETKILKGSKAIWVQFTPKQRETINAAKQLFVALNGDTVAFDNLHDLVIVPHAKSESLNLSILTYEKGEYHSVLKNKSFRLKLVDDFGKPPFFTKDTIVFGLLILLLALVFYTSSRPDGFWKKLHIFLPALLLCYLLPSILSSFNIISPEWIEPDAYGNGVKVKSGIYHVASRYLLPAALILLTLSLDLKAVFKLGWKALVMFLTGTLGIIIGCPIAILIVAAFSPETVGGDGFDAVWRGLSTLAGSWIGGGANQTAMLEVYKYNQENYGAMVLVDIVVANIWMAVLLFGIGKKERIDRWFKADNTYIE